MCSPRAMHVSGDQQILHVFAVGVSLVQQFACAMVHTNSTMGSPHSMHCYAFVLSSWSRKNRNRVDAL